VRGIIVKVLKFIGLVLIILAVFGVMTIFMTGCSGAKIKKASITENSALTAQNAHEKCKEPDESYSVTLPAIPVYGQVMRFYNCLGVPDMLLVAWGEDALEKHITSAHLLMLLYVEFNNNRNPNEPVAGKYVKTDVMDGPATEGNISKMSVSFFKLLPVPVEKPKQK
jgi:hypothetical protein